MRTSTLTALAALAADESSHHRQFIPSSHLGHPSTITTSHSLLNNNDSSLALRQMKYINRGGDAAGARVGVSFGEVLADNKKGYSIIDGDITSDDNSIHPSVIIATRGGDKSTSYDNTVNEDGSNNNSISIFGLSPTPQALATLSMATCMSFHYLAYSLARPATMTLFTSSRLGFGNSVSAYPFAMTFISPMSFILLIFYGRVLNAQGPYLALKTTTIGCASILGLCSIILTKLDPMIVESNNNPTSMISNLTKYIVGALFIFRESYVQLITSQHWSFISSVLTPSQSSTWFAPISGLTSITSAVAAMAVGRLSSMWGLQGVLGVAALVLGGSVVFGELAYSIAEKVSLLDSCFSMRECIVFVLLVFCHVFTPFLLTHASTLVFFYSLRMDSIQQMNTIERRRNPKP